MQYLAFTTGYPFNRCRVKYGKGNPVFQTYVDPSL
jgi:hypothetical protein